MAALISFSEFTFWPLVMISSLEASRPASGANLSPNRMTSSLGANWAVDSTSLNAGPLGGIVCLWICTGFNTRSGSAEKQSERDHAPGPRTPLHPYTLTPSRLRPDLPNPSLHRRRDRLPRGVRGGERVEGDQ